MVIFLMIFTVIQCEKNTGPSNQADPVLRAEPVSMQLTGSPMFDVITIYNGGGVEWRITRSPTWLDFEVLSDIVYGRPQSVPFRVDFREIEYSEYKDTVRVESNGGVENITTYLIYYREEEVYPGIGVANIQLGDAYNKVKKILGNPNRNWYERPAKTVFVHFFIYENIGLICSVQNDSPILYGSGAVGYIKVFAPYDGLTVEKKIGIGSSRADMLAAYGDPTSINGDLYFYDIGITFQVMDDVVAAMIIE
jgi:hypothetical protein